MEAGKLFKTNKAWLHDSSRARDWALSIETAEMTGSRRWNLATPSSDTDICVHERDLTPELKEELEERCFKSKPPVVCNSAARYVHINNHTDIFFLDTDDYYEVILASEAMDGLCRDKDLRIQMVLRDKTIRWRIFEALRRAVRIANGRG